MSTSVADPQIEGLPAGFTVKPIGQTSAPVEGLPAGYTVKPIAAPNPPAPTPAPVQQTPAAAAPQQPSFMSKAASLFGLAPTQRIPGAPGVDLSAIPAPLPKTGPPATYAPSPQEAADLPPASTPDLHSQAQSKYGFLRGQNVELVDKRGTKSPYQSETWAAGNDGGRPKQYDLSKNYIERYSDRFSPDDYAAEVFSHIDPKGQQYATDFLKTLTPQQMAALKKESLDYRDTLKNGQSENEALRNASQSALRGYVFNQWPADAWKQFGFDSNQKSLLEQARHYAQSGPAPATSTPAPPEHQLPDGSISASSPSLAQRGMDVLRNSPIGHAVQSEFPGAPEWMKPTTKQGSPEYKQEQEQFRPEQLVEGVTQQQVERGIHAVAPTATVPAGTFRATPDAPATPAESRAVGLAKAAGEFASAPSIASQVGIAAATGGLGEILAAPLVPAVAGKVVHSLIGAGFTAQMAASVIEDIKTWQEAHAKGDERAANEAMGHMALSGAMTALAGLGTIHEGKAAIQEARAPKPAPAEEKPVLHESNDVEQLRASAERQAPALGDAVKDATEAVPGAKLEAVRDSKDSDRIEAKAERQGVEPSQIGDIAAVKVTVPDQAAADKVLENLHEQMPVESVNGQVNGEPGKNGVRQVQATVDLNAAPGEPVKKAEVLIQTPEMAKAASDTHDDYRKAQELRAVGDEEGAKKIEADIAAKHDAAEQAARARQQAAPEAGGAKVEGEPKYKFASTQHNIDEKSEAGQALNATRSKIADADLAGDGKDIDGNHVTVRYGLKHDLTPEMRAFLESQSPFDATLGPTESFKPSENSDGAAPIIAPIESPELERLNKEIEQHGDFEKSDFPDYKPHATVAYVKPEAAAKYTGDKSTAGKKFRVDSISVTDRNGNATEIPLKGGAETTTTEDKVERVPVDQIALDPKRFQYKMNTDQSGVTNLLKGRKWNEQLAGRINVWRDPADGKLYVVNGHHRYQLARENGVKDVKVDYIKADNAQEARAVGALQNIAEGRGSVMDAAKFFRDSKATPESLDSLGVSMGEATAAHGMALARLDPSIFDQVVQGKIRPGRAIAIGNASADPADQEALLGLINKAESKGKRVTDDVVDELARMVKGAGQHTETQTNLFGAQEMTRNLALEKADISSHIREKIGQERRTFQSVADSGKAAQLSAKVAGQKLKPEENAKIAEAAKMAQELYDRHSTRAGTIDDILNRAAKELAEGGKPSEVRQRAYDDIRAELARSLSGIVEEGGSRVPAPAQKERAAGKAPIPPERAADTGRSTEPAGARVQESPEPVKAPKPREPLFNEGRQTTPIEARAEDGNWKRGTLDYYNGGVNGQPRRGRVTLEDGTKMNNVPDEAMRMAAGARKIEIPNKDVKPVTHSPGEADVIERTKANAEKLTADYLEKNTSKAGVPNIATDAAKELYPEFKADPVGNDRDVAAGAKAVRNWALDHALAEPIDPARPDVLITTASPGSGKTVSLTQGGEREGVGMKIEAISDADKGFHNILQKVIDSGRRPVVEWIYVDSPAKTVRRMFLRAIGHGDKPGIGRTVQLAYMADAYNEIPRVIERTLDRYGDKIDAHVVDNSGKFGEHTVSSDVRAYVEKAKQKSYNEIKEEMDAEVEQLRSEGLFESERGRESLKAAFASDEKPGEFEEDRPRGEREQGVEHGDGKVQQRSEAASSLLTPEKQLEQERQANDTRASERKAAVQAAADRSLRENAANHQSKIEEFKGRKAVVLDPDGEAVWHRVFRKIVRGPLGAGEAWRGMQLDRIGVNTAIAYLKGAVEDFKVAGGVVDEKAIDGLNRMADLLKQSRNEQGGSVILRGDYRADTAREEAGHQWQVEHNLQKSDAMTEVASRPEFAEAVDKLKEMGYKDASARTLAMEAMSKAMAGDLDFPITDAQREDLVRSFLTAAVEEKGPRILDNLPEVDPRVRGVVDEIKEQYGEHDERGAKGGPGQADRAEDREARNAGGEGNAGPRARDQERRGQRTDAGAREAVPEERASKAELEAAGQGSMFQRKAPRPVRAEDSFALPGMENVDREREAAGGEAQAKLLSDEMRRPKGDISEAAGDMERNSPLFYGKGENPSLFSEQSREQGQGSLFDSGGDNPTLFQHDKEPAEGDIFVTEPKDIDKGDKLAGGEKGWKEFYSDVFKAEDPKHVADYKQRNPFDPKGAAKLEKPRWTSGGRMILSPEKDGSFAVRMAESLHEGKGVATAMYRKAIEYAKSQGAPELTSDPEGGSKDAVAGIWKKLGAVETPGVGEKAGKVRWRLDLTKVGDREPATMFQRASEDKEAQKQNPWFLKSAKVIDAKMKGPMPGDALVKMLENNGVKPEEIKWSGLEELRGEKRVTPEQVKQHLAENAIKIEEVTHGSDPHEVGRIRAERERLHDQVGTMDIEEGNRRLDELRDREDAQNTGTRFEGYALPGGENYREMLFTLPIQKESVTAKQLPSDEVVPRYTMAEEGKWDDLVSRKREISDGRLNPLPGKEAEYADIERKMDAIHAEATRRTIDENATQEKKRVKESATFRSSHWEEPNVLGHIRMNDRTGPNGENLLHLEELQSDWHQKGRSQGYGDTAIASKAINDAQAEIRKAGQERHAAEKEWHDLREKLNHAANMGELNTPENKALYQQNMEATNKFKATDEALSRAEEAYDELQRKGEPVPDAPFKKSWPELLFKRMVRYAAENGYDGISWTPGEQQAERYDLSKQISKLNATQTSKGKFAIQAYSHDAGGRIVDDVYDAEKLRDVVGKDLAEKILAGVEGPDAKPFSTQTFSGLDLKVGGEGMKGFYDKIVPDLANKIGKPFGAKVGEIPIRTDPNTGDVAVQENSAGGYEVTDLRDPFGPPIAEFDRQEEAYKYVKEIGLGLGETKMPYLPVTDEMRASAVNEGMPLFQKGTSDEEGPIAKSVRDLVDEMKAAPKTKGTMLDRVSNWSKDSIVESVDRSQKAFNKVPDAFDTAWAWSKATTAALIHDYMHPIEQTDWKRAAGQMQLAEAESAQRLLSLGREIKKTVPKELDRIAISHYMEAGGDDRKLRTWALGAKALALKAQGDPLLSRARKSYLRDAVEHYEAAQKLTPEQKALAGRLRQHFDDMLDIAQKQGIIDYGYRNYVMHLYDKEEAARILNEVDTNELNPNPGFIKKRFYDTLFTAEQSGMTPRSKDIGYLLTAYDKSLNQAVASRNFMRSLLDAKAPDGRPIAAIRAKEGWVTVDEDKGLQVLSQRQRPASLEGYELIDRPQLRGFLFKPTTEDLAGYDPKLFEDNPEGLAFKGSLMIHPKYVGQITDMLTPGWFDRAETWPQKIGKGIQTFSGAAKELMTAAAPFHMVQLGVHGVEHKVNPFKLPEIDLSGKGEESQIQRLLASHGLALVNYDAEGLFGTRALHGIAEHVPFVNKAMDSIQAFSHWQFQDYIPKLKMQMAVEAFKRNTKLYGKKLSEEQIAELTSKESNAAFGNLNTVFDSVPRTKTFKQLLKLATFAPDFLESRIRFVGQAFTKYGGEQRAALARGALAMYVAARIGNAMLNNGDAKWDPEHAFSLVINGKAYALRTVQGDLLHAVDDPRGFIYNRLNPLTTRPAVEFLSGRDQMGREKTAGDQIKDLAKAVLPFGAQKIIQTPDESLWNSVLTSAGINARNDRTQTEEEVHRLYLKGIPSSPQDEEQQAEHRKLRKLEDGIREGSKTPAEVWALVDKGEISPREAARTVERGQQSRLQIEFKGLRLKDAMAVYEKMQKEANHPQIYPYVAMELSELKPEMAYKASHAIADLPEADREAIANKLDALLSAPDPQLKK